MYDDRDGYASAGEVGCRERPPLFDVAHPVGAAGWSRNHRSFCVENGAPCEGQRGLLPDVLLFFLLFFFSPLRVWRKRTLKASLFSTSPNHVRHILVVGRHGHRELHPQKVYPTNYNAAHCFYGHQHTKAHSRLK